MKKKLLHILSVVLVVLGSLFGALYLSNTARALPEGFSRTQIVGSGLSDTSGFEFAPDGRIFILERTGAIKIYKDGALLPTPFYEFSSVASGDRGLIGIAFDPNFAVNNYVYFYYTDTDLRNYLVRMDASGDVFSGTPDVIFQTTEDSNLLHVGGSIAFGPDGKLYFAVGDNGFPPNAQDLTNPFGKIHRVNPDGTIPSDNPFSGQAGVVESIWAYGFRNPWRFQFDSATGRMYGGDVGNDTWEEVNLIEAGQNYGWPQIEGDCQTDCAGLTDPQYAYNHEGGGAAITGGPVYRGDNFPAEYQGDYFFGDYVQGRIRHMSLDAQGQMTDVGVFEFNAGSVVDLKTASDGSLYYITYYPAALYRIVYSPDNQLPHAVATSDIDTGIEPLTVNFSSEGSYDPEGEELSFSWDFGDGTSSTEANPQKLYPNPGVYTATLTVSDGVNAAQAIPLVINAGLPPTILFGAPNDGDMYRAGDEFTFNVFANDAAGFDVNDGDIITDVVFHHDDHTHPFVDDVVGRTGTFTIPDNGESAHDTWYAIQTTATDTNGLSTTDSIFIYPYKSTVTLDANIPGVSLELDGTPHTAPHTFIGVENFKRQISAPQTVTVGAQQYVFDSWSNGGDRTQTIATPEDDTTYTANYVEAGPAEEGSFETFDFANNPVGLRSSGWGNNTTLFSVTDDAHTGAFAGRIDIDNYVSGDAKWSLVPLEMTGGNTYVYSSWYKSSTQTKAVMDITLADGSHQYVWLGLLSASPDTWQELSAEIAMPENAIAATTYQYLYDDGWLIVDDLSFTDTTEPDDPNHEEEGENIFVNGDIETAFLGSPANWSQGSWGDNTVTFSAVAGHESSTGLRVELSDYSSGNAKWITHQIDVDHAGAYSLSNHYRSTVESAMVVEVILDDDSRQYIWLGGINASAEWTEYTAEIDLPDGAVGIKVQQQIAGDGWLETDDYSLIHEH